MRTEACLNLLTRWVFPTVTLIPFVVVGTGWISVYLIALTQGTEEAWHWFSEANVATIVGYGMTVTFLPLLAQPTLLAMVAVELVFLGLAARVASMVEHRFNLDSRLKRVVLAIVRRLPYREAIIRVLLPPTIQAKVVGALRSLIPVFEHETPERPYRAVFLYVVLPTTGLAVGSFSVLTLLAAANPGELWIPHVLRFASTVIGYVGAVAGVIVLASLGVSLVDPKPFPRVIDWKGVLAAATVLYACMVLSMMLLIVA